MRRTNHPAVLLLTTCLTGMIGCRSAPQHQPGPPRVDDAQLEVGKVFVHQVRLVTPVRLPDASGVVREYTTAFLVRLKVHRPPSMEPLVRFYVGDYEVPESGGWKRGVYFKVYDRARLQGLDGKDLWYSYRSVERRRLGARFEVPADQELAELHDERELLLNSD